MGRLLIDGVTNEYNELEWLAYSTSYTACYTNYWARSRPITLNTFSSSLVFGNGDKDVIKNGIPYGDHIYEWENFDKVRPSYIPSED